MARLHTRIYLHSVAVLVVACLTTAVVFAFGARGAFMREMAERVTWHLASLVGERFDDRAAVERQLRRIQDELGVDVTVRDLDGRVVASTGSELPALSREDTDRARAGAVIVRGRPVWHAAAPIRDPVSGGIVGYLEASARHRVGFPHILWPVLAVVLVLLLVALVTVPVARRISRPLERLTAAARRLGGGDLSARVPAGPPDRSPRWWRRRGGNDEVNELTRAFNEMADRVERLVRGQKELLANVSHELRSPLTRIRMALELLPRDAPSEVRLRGVEADLADLDRLIADILTTARLDALGLPTRLDALDARRFLADIAERARHDPALDGKTIHVVAGDPVPLFADEALLRRAVWNLVENAARYGASPITLAAERRDDRVVLSVTDEGIGIRAADRERVFMPFYRGDRARTPGDGRGVGLGLTLAARVVEVHGGAIAIEAASTSCGDEHGCRVVITLPAGNGAQ